MAVPYYFNALSSIVFSLSNKAPVIAQNPPDTNQIPPTKGRAMPGEENHTARLMKIKPETKQTWLNHHSPFVRNLGMFFTSQFDN